MEVIPAIDVVAGRVTRLRQGDYDAATTYDATVGDLAAAYVAQGARRLHLVDLDGAREGRWGLGPAVAEAVAAGLAVQTAGGMRGAGDVERALAAGADRVLVGSLAVSAPATVAGWIDEFGAGRVGICLDARGTSTGWDVATHGWGTGSGRDVGQVWAGFATAPGFVLATDISRDGMLAGPGIEFYEHLRPLLGGAELIASGGVTTPDDVRALAAVGCDACVVGRAVIEDPALYAALAEAGR